jgi:flagellar basal body-associated protein FliL
MSRGGTNGSKVVLIAVTATLAALGVGTVYVPFFMDRDKLRGMHEDADGNLSEKERREYAMLLSQLHEQQMNPGSKRTNVEQQELNVPSEPVPIRKDNSMWARMKSSSAEKK